MRISEFTVPELTKFRELCNFTKDEMELFELRSNDIPLEKCAEIMDYSISAIKTKSARVTDKIIRVQNFL